jgi:CDP-diacylglycerol--glycerol-3-phosphate 3-phosphatidyltransferase
MMGSQGKDWRNLPNMITMSRLAMAFLLFAMLTLEIRGWGIIGDRHLALNLAALAFILCVATDFIDGYLARRWKMVTAFGRLADSFVDKIVICGTLVYLVHLTPDLIRPWLVVIIVGALVVGPICVLRSRFIPAEVAVVLDEGIVGVVDDLLVGRLFSHFFSHRILGQCGRVVAAGS